MKYRPSTTVKVLIAAVLVAPLAIPINDYREKRQIKRTFAKHGLVQSPLAESVVKSTSPEEFKKMSSDDIADMVAKVNRAETMKKVYRGKAYTADQWLNVKQSITHDTASVATPQMDCHGISAFVFDSRTESSEFLKQIEADNESYAAYTRDREKVKNLSTEVGREKMCKELYPEKPAWIPA